VSSLEKPIPEDGDDESRPWWLRSWSDFLVGVVLIAVMATGGLVVGVLLLIVAASVVASMLLQ
jgi:hypothetical protein